MGTATGLTAVLVLLASAVGSGLMLWAAGARRRAAQLTLDNSRLEADRLTRQAERDAESIRKEAALEAREAAHSITAAAEGRARERQQEISSLEQALADKTRSLADRLSATARLEQDLRARAGCGARECGSGRDRTQRTARRRPSS
jgi:ribonuclease Y